MATVYDLERRFYFNQKCEIDKIYAQYQDGLITGHEFLEWCVENIPGMLNASLELQAMMQKVSDAEAPIRAYFKTLDGK